MPENIGISQVIDHLFRHESGRLVSVLTGVFGPENMQLAEDVVQDSMVEAMEHWQYEGVPDDPSAWLFRVAKNKALNILNREKYKRKYISDTTREAGSQNTDRSVIDIEALFHRPAMSDDQLRMIFTCCHPAISPDSQIALALKTLCGFSIPEIARAFLTTEDTINKRLVRARQGIRDAKIRFEIPGKNEFTKRLDAVLETIYLLFNEGYSASRGNDIIRYELCEEAIRLAQIIIADKNLPGRENIHALIALMFINASRFKARQDKEGNLLTLEEQDRSLWDKQMLAIGLRHLADSTQNQSLGIYHIMAAISAQYTIAPSYEMTDWKSILSFYDVLATLDNSPVVLLNRAIAVSKVEGPAQGLAELEKIKYDPVIKSYHLFYSTQAELYIREKDYEKAMQALETAIQLAPLQSEKEILKKKAKLCREKMN